MSGYSAPPQVGLIGGLGNWFRHRRTLRNREIARATVDEIERRKAVKAKIEWDQRNKGEF